MYLYLTILGFLFVVICSIVINFFDYIYPNNKISYFLNPSKKTAFNRVSTSVLPIIIWGFIAIPILGSNKLFLVGVLTNIFVCCSVMYVIKYSMLLLFKKENGVIEVISIIFANLFGFLVEYIILLINSGNYNAMMISIMGILLILLFYLLIKSFPPKSDFFEKEM